MISSKGVDSPQRLVAVLAVTKTGLGTPVLSGLCAAMCSVTYVGVGVYDITVNTKRPFENGLVVSALLHTAGNVQKDVANSTKLKVRIKTFAVDGTTAAEKDFDMMVLGSYAKDLIS